jgi:tetratricopeptide (TPR) repeat protein
MIYNPAVFLLFTAVYLNLSVDRLYIMETYITPAYFPMSLFLGLGIMWLAGKIHGFLSKKHLPEFILFLAVILPQIIFFYPRLDKSRYYYAYDYNRNMLLSVEDNGILFATGDGIIFPMWYLRYVKHYRTDVTLVGTAVLPMRWVRDNIKEQNPDIKMPVINTDKIGTESTGAIMNAIIRMNFSRYPIYFAYAPTEEGAIDPQLKLMPKASVFKLMLKNYAYITDQYLAVNKNLWKIYNLRGVFGRSKEYADTNSADLYINDYAVALNTMAQFCEDSNDYNLALDYFTMAHKFHPKDNEYLYNMGTTYFNLGNMEKSVEMFKASLALNPKYESAWYNLGVVYYKQNRLSESLDAFLQLKKANPDRKDIDPTITFLQNALSQPQPTK